MVYIKNYIFNHFYQQYLVLLTMVPRNRKVRQTSTGKPTVNFESRCTGVKSRGRHRAKNQAWIIFRVSGGYTTAAVGVSCAVTCTAATSFLALRHILRIWYSAAGVKNRDNRSREIAIIVSKNRGQDYFRVVCGI